jgi:hypothetical protein
MSAELKISWFSHGFQFGLAITLCISFVVAQNTDSSQLPAYISSPFHKSLHESFFVYVVETHAVVVMYHSYCDL